MGKEYRVFFESTNGFDIWIEIAKHKKGFSTDRITAEKRTDNYINIGSADFGLKFRGGNNGLLELKTKNQEVEHVEKWKKQASTAKSSDEVIPTLRKFSLSLTPELKTKLDQCIKYIEEHSIAGETFTFKKARKNVSIRIGDISPQDPRARESVTIEQVDMEVEHNGKSLGSWRSICIEGEKRKALIRMANLLLTDVLNKQVMGYPGFVLFLKSRL